MDPAEADCMSLGGHLVSITSNAKNGVVFTFRGTKGRNRVWIGLNDKAVEDSFVWSDGTNSSYRHWSNCQTNSGNSDCTRIESDSEWAVRKCSSSYYYVCESPAPIATTHSPTTIGMDFAIIVFKF